MQTTEQPPIPPRNFLTEHYPIPAREADSSSYLGERYRTLEINNNLFTILVFGLHLDSIRFLSFSKNTFSINYYETGYLN